MAAKRAAKEPRDDHNTGSTLFNNGGVGNQEAKAKALASTMEDLDKRFGEGTIVRLGDAKHMVVDSIPSGSLTVDIAIGVGGIPRGRVTEIYGPESSGKTTLCLHVIAEAQKRGGLAAFVDMEHALDPSYAARIGVNIDTLYVSQPDTAEQALEITEALVRSAALDIVVLDSVAALVPRVEIEGEMGDSHVGIQARLMSQALRKLSGAIKQSNVAVMFTNQLRDKIGVMYGCFDDAARVMLADGSTEAIGTLVAEQRPAEVLSYNPRTRAFEPRRIVSWFDNGDADEFLQFEVAGDTRTRTFACTPNHHLLTPEGYEEAGGLQVGDLLMTSVPHYLSPMHEQVILGSLLGSGCVSARDTSTGDYSAQLRVTHAPSQSGYCGWKESLLEGLIGRRVQNAQGETLAFNTLPMYELRQLADLFYDPSQEATRKQVVPEMLYRLGRLAVAVWYMDSGTLLNQFIEIDSQAFSFEDRQLLVDWLNAQGMDAKNDAAGKVVFASRKAVEKFQSWIACYIHPSMEHKLAPEYRGQFRPIESDPCEHLEAVPMPILNIQTKPKADNMRRYDLEVEGNHCYLVDGVVVHNSPETTSGGRALKFYASVRLDVRKLEQLKGSGGEVIGARTRIRVTKNKVAPPFREAEFDIMFLESGISKSGEVLDLGTELGFIEKRGAFFRYNDGLLGQGRENAKQYLIENPAISEEIESSIRVHYGMAPSAPMAAPAVVDDVPSGD